MGCNNAVLPKPLLKNTQSTVSRLKKPRDNLCLFCALALHLHVNQRVEEETSKLFNLFINKMDRLSADQFQGVQMNDIPIVEDVLTLSILLYHKDTADGNIVGEIARRSVQKYQNTVRLLRYNNQICS